MEQSIAVKIAFLVVAAGHAASALDAAPWWMASPRRACTAPAELTCSTDCSELLVCIGDGSGGYEQEVVAVCPSDTTCSAENAACVAPGSSECHPPLPADQFTCRGLGIFPDPYDCQKYHVCKAADAVSVTGTCDGTTAYNPLKADCSLTAYDRVCTEGPIPQCDYLGDLGVVPENPAIFYICKDKGGEMVPEISRCTANLIFDPTTASCVEPSTTSEPTQPACPTVTPEPTSPTSVTPEPTSPTSVTPEPTSPTSVTPEPTSPTSVTPEPTSPTSVTPEPTSPTSVTPEPTSPTSVTPEPTSPTSVTPEPTSPTSETPEPTSPTSVTPEPTSPTSVTPPAGRCTTQAEIIPDPADCTSYYQCIGETWQHINCIYGYYFDSQLKKCVYGTCPAR